MLACMQNAAVLNEKTQLVKYVCVLRKLQWSILARVAGSPVLRESGTQH